LSNRAIAWSDDYKTGIKAVDDDHKSLFQEIATLGDMLEKNESPDTVSQVLSCLEHYVEEHFAREERFMVQAGYPKTLQHIKIHRRMTQRVARLRQLYSEDPSQIDHARLSRFLEDWLTHHILKVDMDYLPYLKGEKSGSSAVDAALLAQEHVHVSPAHKDVVERFVHILESEQEVAKQLSSAIVEFEDKLEEQELAMARELFCKPGDGDH